MIFIGKLPFGFTCDRGIAHTFGAAAIAMRKGGWPVG